MARKIDVDDPSVILPAFFQATFYTSRECFTVTVRPSREYVPSNGRIFRLVAFRSGPYFHLSGFNALSANCASTLGKRICVPSEFYGNMVNPLDLLASGAEESWLLKLPLQN